MMEYFKTIISSVIPTFLIYIGNTDGFLKLLIEHKFIEKSENIANMQFWCFLFGCLWAGLIIPVQLAKTKIRLREIEEEFNELLKFNKEIHLKSAKEKIKKQSVNFRTRVFIPEKGFVKIWKNFRYKKQEFRLKYFKSISDSIAIKNLQFEVTPNIQGMVGKTFECKKILIDFDVQKTDYNLSYYQRSNTSDVKFCSTVPIFDEKNKVKAIISVDSEKEVVLNDFELKEWNKSMTYYGSMIDKHLKL